MTKQEAYDVVAYLNAAFPREALEPQTVVLWADELEGWVDSQAAIGAAHATARFSDRFPTLKDFRATYRAQLQARQADRPALPAGDSEPIPEWVHVWAWYRRHNRIDERPFPQQNQRFAMTASEYTDIWSLWVKAGSPRASFPEVKAA